MKFLKEFSKISLTELLVGEISKVKHGKIHKGMIWEIFEGIFGGFLGKISKVIFIGTPT